MKVSKEFVSSLSLSALDPVALLVYEVPLYFLASVPDGQSSRPQPSPLPFTALSFFFEGFPGNAVSYWGAEPFHRDLPLIPPPQRRI